MARNTCLKILTQNHFTPSHPDYSSFTEWTVIGNFEEYYQKDHFSLSKQVWREIKKLVQDSYTTADGHLLENQIIELADWEEFENDVYIPQPIIICQHFYTFNRLVSKEEFLGLYHFGEEGGNFGGNS